MLPVLARGVQLAVYLAQQATSAAVVEATGITESELLHDRQDLGLERRPRGFVFTDNIGLLGKDCGEVDMLMESHVSRASLPGLADARTPAQLQDAATSWGSSWMVTDCVLVQRRLSTRSCG